MIRYAAIALSWVLHPLLLATYMVLLLGFALPHFMLIPATALWTFVGLVFVMTFLLPVINLLMFRAFGSLPSLQMASRRERIVPFVLIAVIYTVVCIMFFIKIPSNVNFNKVMLIVGVLVLLSMTVTFFEKVSIHSLAMGGMTGIVLPLNKVAGDGSMLWPTAVLLVLTGAVMSARLYLNAHTMRQVLYGAGMGLLVGVSGMLLLFR